MGKSVRKIPTFDEVMQDEPPKRKIPSYDEVMGIPVKKKVGSIDFDQSSTTPSASEIQSISSEEILKLAHENRDINEKEAIINTPIPAPGATVSRQPDPSLRERQKSISEQIKKEGYDPAEIYKEFGDFPLTPNADIPKLLQEKKENPLSFERTKAAFKYQVPLFKAIREKEPELAENIISGLLAGQEASYYGRKRYLTKDIHNAINKYVDDPDDRKKMIGQLAIDKGNIYGIDTPEKQQDIEADPRFVNLNKYQIEALNFLEDTDPEKYQVFNDKVGTLDVSKQQGNESLMRGYEQKARELERLGMQLEQRALDEQGASFAKKFEEGTMTQQDMEQYQMLKKQWDFLQQDLKTQSERFPNIAALDADALAQEALGQRNGSLKRGILGIGENVGDAINWMGDILQSPFRSKEERTIDDLEDLGDKKFTQNVQRYRTAKNQLLSPDYIPEFQDELKTGIENIKSSNTDDKLGAVRNLILSNMDKVKTSKNKDAGSFNFTPNAIFNTVSDTGAEILSTIGLTATTGGFGNISKIRQLSTLFGTTFATAYNDYYTEAIEKNIKNPTTYATIHTAIEAGSELINNDIDMVKKLVNPRSTLGQIVGNITKKQWDDIAKAGTGRFGKILQVAKGVGQRGVKNAFQETGEEMAGQLGGNVADLTMFNQDVDLTDGLKSTFVNTIIGTLPLGLLGLGGELKQLNRNQKYGLYEAAQNKDKYLGQLSDDVKNGIINPKKAYQIKAIIENASAKLNELSEKDTINVDQTDNEKADILVDQMIESSITDEQRKEIKDQQSTEAKRNKLIEKGHNAIDKLLEEKDDKGHFVFKGVYRDVAKSDPLLFLEEVAQQAQGIDKDGNRLEGGGREFDMIPKYGADIINVAKELFPAPKPGVSVLMPGEAKQPETTTIAPKEPKKEQKSKGPKIILPKPKTEENAIPEQAANEMDVRQQAGDGKRVGEGNARPEEVAGEKENQDTGEEKPPISEPPAGAKIHAERPATELSHRGLQDVANEFSLPDVQTRDRKTDIELRKEAEDTINEWVDKKEYSGKVDGLVNKAEAGDILTDKERVILEQHLSNISQELRELPKDSAEFDSKLTEVKRLKDAGEKTRSGAGAALRIPTFRSRPKDLTDYYVAEMEAAGVEKLTEQQKQTVEKEFNQISEAEKAYNEKIQALKDENAKLRAQIEVAKAGKQKGQKKDFKKEREDIFTSIQEKLKKARQDTQVTIVPYAKELIAIAPDVAKLVRSYAEQGVVELSEMVKKIHGDLKPAIEDITEKDVQDLIAGVYNEKKPSRDKLAQTLRDLRDEAKLLNKLDELESGKEPTIEKKKIERNRKITDLKEKLKRHDLTRLAETKNRIKKQIEQIEKQIESGDFEKEKQPEIKLDKEAVELRNKLIQLRSERQKRILIQEYEKSSRWNKIQTGAANILGVPRTIMASMDYSAPLRQALLPTLSHPIMASKAAAEMFKSSFSQKHYDRWFDNLHNSERFKLMNDSKLALTDVNNPKLSAKEEQYMNGLAEKIPVIGRMIKGSERAYTIYLNKMRVDLFNRFADQMQKDGRTFENSPDQYKQMAAFVNNMTGRGDLGKTLNEAAPVLNQLFFSPRLMASRINTLTYLAQPRFWKKAPVEVRKDYFRSMLTTAGIGLTILGLAKLAGADTEDDPRSPDFGKIKSGNTRWDIWGGHQQYIRVAAQLISGKTKSSTSGNIYELGTDKPFGRTRGDVGLAFLRGKLAPVPSLTTDIISGRNAIGDKLTTNWESGPKEVGLGENIANHLFPLTVTGMSEALKDQGAKAWFTVGVPSIFGVGTTTYETMPTNSKADKPGKEAKKDKK